MGALQHHMHHGGCKDQRRRHCPAPRRSGRPCTGGAHCAGAWGCSWGQFTPSHCQLYLFCNTSGAVVDARTNGGATALHRAAVAGHLEVARTLLAQGACALLQDSDGEAPLHKAAAQGHAGVVALLLTACPQAALLLDKRGLTPQCRATGAAADAVEWPSGGHVTSSGG